MQNVRLRIYTANQAMARHMHEDRSFTVVIHGSYHETSVVAA